jgi:hypothetical protein
LNHVWINHGIIDSHGVKGQKTFELIVKILQGKNLYKSYRRVIGNKGSCGVDGMKVSQLQEYLLTHQRDLVQSILANEYLPTAIR